jgi:hypothetical protein
MLGTEADFAKHFVVPDPRYLNIGYCPKSRRLRAAKAAYEAFRSAHTQGSLWDEWEELEDSIRENWLKVTEAARTAFNTPPIS